ncbi:class I tRNA ligase family protein [Flavihumibacter sp. R14]|nr:class I tRNA ligase family protein [Flavihumibacter soli]
MPILSSRFKTIRQEYKIGDYRFDFFVEENNVGIAFELAFPIKNRQKNTLRKEYLQYFNYHFVPILLEELFEQDFEKKLRRKIEEILVKPQLSFALNYNYQNKFEYELSTMPGWAGSSWYWLRYMASKSERKGNTFVPNKSMQYWRDVDLYIGGSEHATGHLLYSRFWNMFLKDLGYVVEEEPFKKLINQGMIQGRSNLVYRLNYTLVPKTEFADLDKEVDWHNHYINRLPLIFLSKELVYKVGTDEEYLKKLETKINSYDLKAELNELGGKILLNLRPENIISKIHVDVNIVENDILNFEKFRNWRPELHNAIFLSERGKYLCGHEVEKMSKSKFNVVNPDDIIEKYGADTLRLYEMFLGPLEQSKPWNTNGIEGVFKFLRKFWKLFHNDEFTFNVSDEKATKAELKALHKIIKKVEEDIERFSFNTSVSSFMICVNELTDLKCNKRSILQELVIVVHPYAPHITEELWTLLGNEQGTLSFAPYPVFNPEYLVENEFAYPISVNGKMRMNLNIALNLEQAEVEKLVLENDHVRQYLDGKNPKKIVFVKGKIVNIVV